MTSRRLFATFLVSVCFSCALAGGCGGGNGTGNGTTSALSGKAIHEVSGGVCCNPPTDTPLANTLLTFHTTTSATEVARVKTDGAGNYTVMLPAGTYGVDLVDRANQPLYNFVSPQQIVILANTPQTVDVKFELDAP